MKGQLVRKLHSGPVQAGANSITWDGTDDSGKLVATGLYLYRLDIQNQVYTRKMLMMK